MPAATRLFLFLCVTALGQAASTQISTDRPVVNFSLPAFTPEGNRSWLVRGSEGRYLPQSGQIAIRELTLSIFSGKADNRIDTIIVSPTALVTPGESVISGTDSIRVINDQLEATGTDWRYAHEGKKVTIAKNVRIVFQAQLKDILQ